MLGGIGVLIEEGKIELIFEGLKGMFPGEKAKEAIPIERGLNTGERVIVPGTLRRVEGRTYN